MTNRYGNFIGGKFYLVHADQNLGAYEDYYSYVRTEGSLMPELPADDAKFNYTGVSGGVWDLQSAYQFPKNNNRTTTSGLTDPLHVTSWYSIGDSYVLNTVNIARYANRSARVVFRIFQTDFTPGDIIIDAVNVSGTTYGFESSGESWETTTSNSLGIPYPSLAWTTVASTRTRHRMARANTVATIEAFFGAGVIPPANGNFGLITTYDSAYGETKYHSIYLRSPVISLGANPTLSYRQFNLYSFYSGLIYTYLDLQ